jgi:hypothetical protein
MNAKTLEMEYQPGKYLWTAADFERMGWHDSTIYKLRFTGQELELDIDYILQWNTPDADGLFTFWVAPATLVFEQVTNFSFDLHLELDDAFEIDSIERKGDCEWLIATHRSDIQFTATGYTQYIRQAPFFQFDQQIPPIDRNGYSLERTTAQVNPNRDREDVLQRRAQEAADYETARQRRLSKKELEALLEAREQNAIDLKSFLLQKKALQELIDNYTRQLKNTRFERW